MSTISNLTKKYIVSDTITTIDFRQSLDKIKNFKSLPPKIQEAIKSADHIESKGFQELLGYDKGNKIMWSAGGYWETAPSEKFVVTNFGGMPCPHCKATTIQWSADKGFSKTQVTLGQKYIIANKKNIEETVTSMISDPNFQRALHDMISAAKSAIVIGHKQGKPDMIKFNTLVLLYCEAAQKKDIPAALHAAQDMVKEGHGAMFGLS